MVDRRYRSWHNSSHTAGRFGARSQGSLVEPLPFLGGDGLRTYVYVDGFNLYNSGLKQDRSLRWLDIQAMCRGALRAENDVIGVRYFTARISAEENDPDGPTRQDAYLRALEAHTQNLSVHFGQFRSERRRRPIAGWVAGSVGPRTVEVIERSEKGSDVNLAVHLVNDAWADLYDCAVVVSNDSDLAEALRIVRSRGKGVGILTTKNRPTGALLAHAHFHRRITNTHFTHSRLPDPVVDPEGRQISCPVAWQWPQE